MPLTKPLLVTLMDRSVGLRSVVGQAAGGPASGRCNAIREEFLRLAGRAQKRPASVEGLFQTKGFLRSVPETVLELRGALDEMLPGARPWWMAEGGGVACDSVFAEGGFVENLVGAELYGKREGVALTEARGDPGTEKQRGRDTSIILLQRIHQTPCPSHRRRGGNQEKRDEILAIWYLFWLRKSHEDRGVAKTGGGGGAGPF